MTPAWLAIFLAALLPAGAVAQTPSSLTAPDKVESRIGGLDTKSGEPAVVVRATKSRIAIFAGPAFQDGSRSTCA